MINFIKKKNKGFTLVSLLLYMAILGSILTAVSGFLFFILQSKQKNFAINEVEQQGYQISRYIVEELNNNIQVNNIGEGNSSSTLSFERENSSGVETVDFYENGGTFWIEEENSSPQKLSNLSVNVSGLNFENVSDGNFYSIKFDFKVSFKNPEGRNEYKYEQNFHGVSSSRK